MDPASWFALLFVVVSLFLAAFATAAEAAFALSNVVHLRHLAEEAPPWRRTLAAIEGKSPRLSSTLAFLSTVPLVVASVLATTVASHHVPTWGAFIAGVAVLVLAYIFARALPRALVARQPEIMALRLIGPLEVIAAVLTPIVWPLRRAADLVLRIIREPGRPRGGVLDAEPNGENEDELSGPREEEEMIQGVEDFGHTLVSEVMIPRIDIAAVEAERPISEALDVIINEGHSRIPVFKNSVDNIVGVLYAKDLLKYTRIGDQILAAGQVMRPAYFIPESKKLDELLHELQQRKVHIAIVIDEYGGTAGLVTIEDLLEEIVGEIQDEYDAEEAPLQLISQNEIVFDGRIPLHDVNELLGLELEAREFETLAGFVYDQLGRMPQLGDVVSRPDCAIQVESIEGNRLRKVRVTTPTQTTVEETES